MRAPRKSVQRALSCGCGQDKILASGMCATCYTLKRQEEEYFGGLREKVLERDGYACRVCNAPGRRKRSITVHHRQPGVSELRLMISLCTRCHARIHRTRVLRRISQPLLIELWREQHPQGHEQMSLALDARAEPAKSMHLFPVQV